MQTDRADAMPKGRRALTYLFALVVTLLPMSVVAQVFTGIKEIAVPVGPDATEPAIFANDGAVMMSWTEPQGPGFAVKTATLRDNTWSAPSTVVAADSLMVNWSDFPTIAAFGNGTLAVGWMRESAVLLPYAYDLNISLSGDAGQSWGNPIIPHDDRSERQHGFLTLLPVGQDELVAIWLDSRAYDDSNPDDDSFENAMQLRSATLTANSGLSADIPLDLRTCSCCQTSAAVAGDGTILVAYRDRTEAEIRDISVVRRQDGVWSDPRTVNDDGWEISGCPINGPAIDADGDSAVVAWFTGADNRPAVKLAFSDDSGASFGPPTQVDTGGAAGRVDVLMLPDGDALVSWVAWLGVGEALMVCRATPTEGCVGRQVIALNRAGGSVNFPRMVQGRDAIYLAWTQPLDLPRPGTTIRLVALTGLLP